MLLGRFSTAAQPSILIRVERAQTRVDLVTNTSVQLRDGQQGLIIWADGERERWQLFTTRWSRPRKDSPSSFELDLASISRGANQHSASVVGLGQLTTVLPQLRPPDVLRGVGSIVTPYNNAAILNPKVTIRRDRGDGKEKLPAVEAVILRGTHEVVTIPIAAGKSAVRWEEIPELPAELKDGLPAGNYRLRMPTPTGVKDARFVVRAAKNFDKLLNNEQKLRELLEDVNHPLYAQVAVERLLDQDTPYLCDAFDLLESLPKKRHTLRLVALRKHVLDRLEDPGREPELPLYPGGFTGDKLIDKVRSLIADGQWERALEELDEAEYDDTPVGERREGLAQLYRGVILSEAGPGKEDEAKYAFIESIKLLGGLPNSKADLFRAHNNYANFMLGRVYDRLHNHTLQMAAGVNLPLLTALQNWTEAKQHYDAALKLASTSAQKGDVRVNLARQYALLSDLLRTLADPADPKRQFQSAEKIASSTAETLAHEALKERNAGGPFVYAVAEELIAQLRFRDGDIPKAELYATRALARYVDHGALSGVVSVQRLLGLLESESSNAVSAIKHLEISERLSEILRLRYPSDRSGMSLAGFLSRRVYVSQKIVELLVNAGKAKEALDHVELAKARSFSDLLHVLDTRSFDPPLVSASKALLNWPQKTVVIEYFITAERCWVFVVSASGVKAVTLKAPDGQDVTPRALLTAVRSARQMLNDYKRCWQDEAFTRRFDDSWQNQLHELYQTLMPKEVRTQLEGTEHVVIVPHHILHYLPFSALVTRLDESAGANRMARPSFLLDEPFAVSYAPSLSSWRVLADKKMLPLRRIGVVADTRPEANLREVATEVQAIRDSFGDKVKVVHKGSEATVENAMRVLGECDMTFFGCHGQNDWDSPLNGHLLLSDRNLTAYALLDKRISSQVVVLSACHSGLADRSPLPGDDLFGLERVLLSRGTNCVVSGSWLVDDLRGARITSALMSNLAKGMAADHALANGQRSVLERYRSSRDERLRFFSHPHFWAVFKLSGVYHAPASAEPATTEGTKADAPEQTKPTPGSGTD